MYSDWIDACENVAQEAAAEETADKNFSDYATARTSRTAAAGAGDDEEDGGYDEEY